MRSEPFTTREPGARLAEIDAARGLALGGMLVINLGVFSGAARVPLARQAGLDWLASLLGLFLAQGKFYPLFALLFGWGIARRQCSGRAGEGFLGRNARRMAVLAGFGLLHAALLWPGDILLAYALVGAFLPLLRRAPTRSLAAAAGAALLLSALLALPGPGWTLRQAYAGLFAPLGAPGGNLFPLSPHLSEYAWKLAYFPDWLGNYVALILLGYAAGRAGLPERGRFSVGRLVIPALLLNGFYAFACADPRALPVEWVVFLRTAALSLGGPLLALVYARAIARAIARELAARDSARRWLLNPLARLGRMPLTTYLNQSLVAALLFPNPTPGRFAPALVWPLAAAIFMFQLAFARLWLARFRRGPVEAAWRWLSG